MDGWIAPARKQASEVEHTSQLIICTGLLISEATTRPRAGLGARWLAVGGMEGAPLLVVAWRGVRLC